MLPRSGFRGRRRGRSRRCAGSCPGTRSRKPVLAPSDPVPDHPDEPQEGDASERDQVQRDHHGGSSPRIGQPRARDPRMGGDDSLSSTSAVMRNTEKTIPAIPEVPATAARVPQLSGPAFPLGWQPDLPHHAHRAPPPHYTASAADHLPDPTGVARARCRARTMSFTARRVLSSIDHETNPSPSRTGRSGHCRRHELTIDRQRVFGRRDLVRLHPHGSPHSL